MRYRPGHSSAASHMARHIKKPGRHDARIVSLAFRRGSRWSSTLIPMMLEAADIDGVDLRSRPDASKAAVARDLQARSGRSYEDARFRTVSHGGVRPCRGSRGAPEDGGRGTVQGGCSRRDWEQARRVIGALKSARHSSVVFTYGETVVHCVFSSQ